MTVDPYDLLVTRVLGVFDEVNEAHWGRLHRGGLVYITSRLTDIPTRLVHRIVNEHYGHACLACADLKFPYDFRMDNCHVCSEPKEELDSF